MSHNFVILNALFVMKFFSIWLLIIHLATKMTIHKDFPHQIFVLYMRLQISWKYNTISVHYISNKHTEVLAVTNTGGTQAQVWENSL